MRLTFARSLLPHLSTLSIFFFSIIRTNYFLLLFTHISLYIIVFLTVARCCCRGFRCSLFRPSSKKRFQILLSFAFLCGDLRASPNLLIFFRVLLTFAPFSNGADRAPKRAKEFFGVTRDAQKITLIEKIKNASRCLSW